MMHQEPAVGSIFPQSPDLSSLLFPKQIFFHLTHLSFQPCVQEGIGLQSRVMDVLLVCSSGPGLLSPCSIVPTPFSAQTYGCHRI